MKAELYYLNSSSDGDIWDKTLIGVDLTPETEDEREALKRFEDKGINIGKLGLLTGLPLYFNDLPFRPRRYE